MDSPRRTGPCPRGMVISGCLLTLALVFFVLWLSLRLFSHTVTDKDFEPKPEAGTPRPYREVELVARVSGLMGVQRVHYSSLKKRAFFEGFSAHLYGSTVHPEEWMVLIPGEKLFIRMSAERQRKMFACDRKSKMGQVFADYGLNERNFPGFVARLHSHPVQGSMRLEQHGPYAVEVREWKEQRRGSMQEGFRLSERCGGSQFCPELGLLFGDGQFSLEVEQEKPLPDSLFELPPGYRELQP